MSDFDDIMYLLGPSVDPFEPSPEITRPAPPTVRDTTSQADLWIPTDIAFHYREYDRSGPALDELTEQIRQNGILTPLSLSTDGNVAVIHEGNHRLQAARQLGIQQVPVKVTLDSPVISNGGQTAQVESYLSSWLDRNQGSLRSFWGARMAGDYFMQHRPAGPDFGAPLHDVRGMYPDDFYEAPHYYSVGEPGTSESLRQILQAQGNPSARITIYRAVPGGVDPVIRSGDWVTTSREYAETHGYGLDDTQILSTTVQAKDLWTEANSLNEWGYHGPEVRTSSREIEGAFPYHDTYTQPFLPGHDWPIYLYRGLSLRLPPSLESELDIAIMEADQSMIQQAGGKVLDMIGNIGRHWTTEPDVAMDFAESNRYTGNLIVVISAVWERKGEDFAEEHVGWDGVSRPSNLADEFEVTLHPGTQVRLLSVKARRVLNGQTIERDWEIELLRSPQMRTAAEPGGVLPWNPSHRGYTWVTHSDGTLEAVTNDAVNRMFLTEEPWGWEWEVYDSLGFVEGGTFGSALRGGDALRQRANELLAEFDTRAEMRTRGPSRGYQDDYTPAPNTLWSKRATTSQRYAERMRRHRLR